MNTDVSKPVSRAKPCDACDEIVKRLQRNTAAGAYLSQVFADWLDLTHACLTALPAHYASITTLGQPAEDRDEAKAVFARCRARYPQPWAWTNFSEALGLLIDSADGFWTAGNNQSNSYGWDVIGAVYMQTSAKEHAGQFFTPWSIAALMAQMTIPDGAQEIADRLRQAQQRASARKDANACLLDAALIVSLALPADQMRDYFMTRILPLIAADFDPITICDPCVGSGVMLLAAARQFPAWAAQAGLVRFFGMDIDQTCVTMAQVNMMLYGLNPTGLEFALTATPRQLATLPEPFQQAYTLAQEAQANGDADLVAEIADTLRLQQTLFDPEPYAVQVRAPTPRTEAKPRRQREALPALLDTLEE